MKIEDWRLEPSEESPKDQSAIINLQSKIGVSDGRGDEDSACGGVRRNARTGFGTFGLLGGSATDGTAYLWDEYGNKLFPGRWLTDDEVRTVRDLDMFEMRRRGMTQWASEAEVE